MGNQYYHQFHFYLFEHMYIICILWFLGIFYSLCIRKIVFCHLTTSLNNPCAHFLFAWRISATMIILNIIINIFFKNFGYSNTIGRILIKININWPNFFYQWRILFYLSRQIPIYKWCNSYINYHEELIYQFSYEFLQAPNMQYPGFSSILFRALTITCGSFNSSIFLHIFPQFSYKNISFHIALGYPMINEIRSVFT